LVVQTFDTIKKGIYMKTRLFLMMFTITLLGFVATSSVHAQSFWFPKERLITGNQTYLLRSPKTTGNKSGTFTGWFNPDANEVFRTMRWGTSETQVFTDTLGVTHTLESLVQTEMNTWESVTTSEQLTWLDISNVSASPPSTWNVEVKIGHCPIRPAAAGCVVMNSFTEHPTEDVATWDTATVWLHPNLSNDLFDYATFVIRHEIGHLHALNDLDSVTSIMSSDAWSLGHTSITQKDRQSLKYYFGKLGKYDLINVYNEPAYPYLLLSYNDWVPNGHAMECHLYLKSGGSYTWLSKQTTSTDIGSYADVDLSFTPYTPKIINCSPNVLAFPQTYQVRIFEVIGVDDSGNPVRVLAHVSDDITTN
jgi:hypothetical protein